MPRSSSSDIDRLQLELEQEKEKCRAVYKEYTEWKLRCAELEADLSHAADDECEWKTKYENQVSHNKLLEDQLHDSRQKISEYKDNMRNFSNRTTTGVEKDSIPGEIQQTIARLTRDKYNLESQLRDYEWRLDQEAKNYHKTNEKRQAFLLDIAKSRNNTVGQHEQESKKSLEKTLRNIDREYKNKKAKQRNGGHSSARRSAKTRSKGRKKSRAHIRTAVEEIDEAELQREVKELGLGRLPDINERYK